MEYTATDRWKVIRGDCLDRANHKCQLCNSNGVLSAHHRTYDEAYAEGCKDSSDLVALCQTCHNWYHISLINGKLSGKNRVANWKKQKKGEAADNFPSGFQYKLDKLIDKHIDIESITQKEYRTKVSAMKEAILMGLI
jgi:hypothetical protein